MSRYREELIQDLREQNARLLIRARLGTPAQAVSIREIVENNRVQICKLIDAIHSR